MAFGKLGRYYPHGADVHLTRFNVVDALRSELTGDALSPADSRRIDFTSDADGLEIQSDRNHFRYILINLVHNALKYSPPDLPVVVSASANHTGLVLQVAARGIGIPVDEKEKLFSPFYRASKVALQQGTGMGLAIVKKSAQLIRAELELASDEGEGTTFTVTFPLKS